MGVNKIVSDTQESKKEIVNITIDGKELQVPKGTNLIEAAKMADTEIPYYCYHPDLSIAGNCRMCQVEVEGMRKLTIGCNTGATEGMVVKTQKTSKKVADAQRSTLEFLLVNHPLDCTVCDQAGHCKLQDYYYEYNSKPSRFLEDKVEKVKAESLGPEIIYDGERCILCTRCVRFCEEVTESGELGLYNRGDKAVIGIDPSNELTNELSGTVADLCPVGALTHKRWRFNTRIWYTKEVESVCSGCSTGCNVKVALRDEQIVHVKGRYNEQVNKEWLCDEGRYGFDRFRSQEYLDSAYIRNDIDGLDLDEVKNEEALNFVASKFDKSKKTAFVLSPFLTFEELWLASKFAKSVSSVEFSSPDVAMQVMTRDIGSKKLLSPDYAPNAKAGVSLGVVPQSDNWRKDLESKYKKLISNLSSYKQVFFFGDFAILDDALDQELIKNINALDLSVAVSSRALVDDESVVSTSYAQFCNVVLPGVNVYQKSGLFLNKDSVLQRVKKFFEPVGVYDAVLYNQLASKLGATLIEKEDFTERDLFFEVAKSFSGFKDLTLAKVGQSGVRI